MKIFTVEDTEVYHDELQYVLVLSESEESALALAIESIVDYENSNRGTPVSDDWIKEKTESLVVSKVTELDKPIAFHNDCLYA